MQELSECKIPIQSTTGTVVAYIIINPLGSWNSLASAPIVEIDEVSAREFGETTIQLKESERYEYRISPVEQRDLRLRAIPNLASRWKSLGDDGKPDAGILETRSYCGALTLELVEGKIDISKVAEGTAVVDIRSVKLGYRTEYRGMLRRLSETLVGLVVDSRSSVRSSLSSNFLSRSDAGWMQIQLELLRDTLDSPEFSAAIQRIAAFPHERATTDHELRETNKKIKWGSRSLRQLTSRSPRVSVPPNHSLLSKHRIKSIASHVQHQLVVNERDTSENRFVKFALSTFRNFLNRSEVVFRNAPGWEYSASLSIRLAQKVEQWLGQSFFIDIGNLRLLPTASPVLQRKSGYREIFRHWLKFNTAAEISWEGGTEMFRAGQRDVASLYEYWLFFELLSWFCKTFRAGNPPPIADLLDGLEDNKPNLKLRKGAEIGPILGVYTSGGRSLSVRFSYNRPFDATVERTKAGSWTRRMHPDYTLSFWPADISEPEAEECELLVHIHFDAKYRVDDIEGLFGIEDEAIESSRIVAEDKTYKRSDLLKMHAYRDAIKRTQGAYVIYPGNAGRSNVFTGFHEILPGLGAFSIVPSESGQANGFSELEKFLIGIVSHISNRTTAMERLSYHVAETYALKEPPVEYGVLEIPEVDGKGESLRPLPPAEHNILVAWINSLEQMHWTREKGLAIVRLGNRAGTLHVQPDIASVRHLLFITHRKQVNDGLFRVKIPGFKIFTAQELLASGYPGPSTGEIYAVFEVEEDASYSKVRWVPDILWDELRDVETRRTKRSVKFLGRSAPIPRIITLRDLLKAKAES